MTESIKLNLEKDILEGFEHFYDTLNVEVLRIARKCGHKFPPVDIVQEEKIYRLVLGRGPDEEGYNYGGHSRSILAYQDKYLLDCRILPAQRKNPRDEKDYNYYPLREIKYIPIKEMQPERKITSDLLYRLNENLQFLPDKLRKRFIEENNLAVSEEGILFDRDNDPNLLPF